MFSPKSFPESLQDSGLGAEEACAHPGTPGGWDRGTHPGQLCGAARTPRLSSPRRAVLPPSPGCPDRLALAGPLLTVGRTGAPEGTPAETRTQKIYSSPNPPGSWGAAGCGAACPRSSPHPTPPRPSSGSLSESHSTPAPPAPPQTKGPGKLAARPPCAPGGGGARGAARRAARGERGMGQRGGGMRLAGLCCCLQLAVLAGGIVAGKCWRDPREPLSRVPGGEGTRAGGPAGSGAQGHLGAEDRRGRAPEPARFPRAFKNHPEGARFPPGEEGCWERCVHSTWWNTGTSVHG